MATRSGGSGSRRSDGGGSGRRRASGAQRRSTSGTRRSSASARTTGADKSVEAFREALERSVHTASAGLHIQEQLAQSLFVHEG